MPSLPSGFSEETLNALLDDVDADDRDDVVAVLDDPELADAHIVRRDLHQQLIAGEPFDGLSGLASASRIGPVRIGAGRDVLFELYLSPRQLVVRIDGEARPSYVLTNARPPTASRARRTIRLDPGTVWIRSDRVGAGFPSGSYVGINHAGGTMKLGQPATFTDSTVDVMAPFQPILELALTADESVPVDGGCESAASSIVLPTPLTITMTATMTATGPRVSGTDGTAVAWGQTFTMTPPATGQRWEFVARLWAALVPFGVDTDTFDPDPINDARIRVGGKGTVTSGWMSLPVVMPPNPALLGAAARAGEWMLGVTGLAAEWYDGDDRRHELPVALVGIAAHGATVLAEGIRPLVPALTHTYDLWNLAGDRHRLPWSNQYAEPFWLLYRCDVIDGESLMVEGRADVQLDRPVTTDGEPIITPTGRSLTFVREFDGSARIMLAAVVTPSTRHQFALRNALVWAASPAFVLVDGALLAGRDVRDAVAHLPMRMIAWVPTLPDPYVSNALISRRLASAEANDQTTTTVVARVRWSTPNDVVVSFDGSLGSRLAVTAAKSSPDQPRPAPKHRDGAAGLTQVEQHTHHLDRDEEANRRKAQHTLAAQTGELVERANVENTRSHAQIEGVLREIVGGPPSLLLLDVSTNQDLLGVAIAGGARRGGIVGGLSVGGTQLDFPVADLAVTTAVGNLRVVALPQVQWEPVRTLDDDQDIITLGWFPTPLASATDGGATVIGARAQTLTPVIPDDALDGAIDAFRSGVPVGVRTTFPFGLIAAINLRPDDTGDRKADLIDITRPDFPTVASRGGIQFTAKAEGGRPDDGGVSPMFRGATRQLINGVDLASGNPLGLSVLGSTGDPLSNVEAIFNLDMAANPKVPVSRVDISGYGGSNFSDWNDPFAAFAQVAKVQFRYMIGRTALEVIKVNSVLDPWGIRVTRTVTVERRPGGGVIRRDSGWQAFTPGIFDFRYADPITGDIVVADYRFDAGVFGGLFDVRSIRPAPGIPFTSSGATLIPYYFDADVALENVPGRTRAIGVLGYLQVTPNGVPAPAAALRDLIQQQGPVGGPIDVWMPIGGSGLPFRAQRVEVGLADDGGQPLFVATVRGAPKLPTTGAWSVVRRQVSGVPVGGGEAVPVGDERGVPLIRRNRVQFVAGDPNPYPAPRIVGPSGDHRLADAADLLTPNNPANDYALLQSTTTHALLFPRPVVPVGTNGRLHSGHRVALADIIARSTSKGAFPPPASTIELAPNAFHFDVAPAGTLALSAPINIVGHPIPLRIAGATGHGSTLRYDTATMALEIGHDRWAADFTGMRLWSDISGLAELTGTEMRIVGSTDQRPQVAALRSMVLDEIEEILRYIPLFTSRGTEGPIELGSSNAKHELKFEAGTVVKFPKTQITVSAADPELFLKLSMKAKTGLDITTGGFKASAKFGALAEGRFPVLTVGVASVFIIVSLEVTFSLTSVSGSVTAEELELTAFAGVGVKGQIGPFKAYAFLGIGFILQYDAIADKTKYGGLVALEAGVDLTIVSVTIRAELKGVVYDDGAATKCDYAGSVEINVDILFVFSISASYTVSETTTL